MGRERTITAGCPSGFVPQPLRYDLLWARVIEALDPLTGQADAPAAAVTLWSLLRGMWALDRADQLGD